MLDKYGRLREKPMNIGGRIVRGVGSSIRSKGRYSP